ncbi:ATP-binding protein [Palleronia caenipelagi]|nr:ATP-binding protein [Palleronia caenipelagi]
MSDGGRALGPVSARGEGAHAFEGPTATPFRGWPLARRIVLLNFAALLIFAAGLTLFNPFRAPLLTDREQILTQRAELMASVFEAARWEGDAAAAGRLLGSLDLTGLVAVSVHSASGRVLVLRSGPEEQRSAGWISRAYAKLSGSALTTSVRPVPEVLAVTAMQNGGVELLRPLENSGTRLVGIAVPVYGPDKIAGAVGLVSDTAELSALLGEERRLVLLIAALALAASAALSVPLASAIAEPLADLAAAAQIRDGTGRDDRISLPDLSDRSDEIGELSVSLRGMVSALHTRIEANEQFAADVAHEIKNPLASLRSAVGALQIVDKEPQRTRLMEIIDMDVRRLDRLVSDISNASRLDAELVKEQEEPFDLSNTLTQIADHIGLDAANREITFIADLPSHDVRMNGLESRLAQVFVNLLTNALSFCKEGDTIRIWCRQRDHRVIVVVEDTGPGIPDAALEKIFERFYSERPEDQFGANSGLGLAISKQIVEAHGGVIWAENIRPSGAGPETPSLGARFVVGLPV